MGKEAIDVPFREGQLQEILDALEKRLTTLEKRVSKLMKDPGGDTEFVNALWREIQKKIDTYT